MAAAFNQYVVRPGLLDARFGKAFSLGLNRRILADYAEGGLSEDVAAEAIANARSFVAAVTALIQPED